ncbi:hypothetical protein TNCV_4436561 [Trichonephila clavipes]|nr:hypothetical protein TNCV_4436561 [Trichonephila clavipes]
MRWNGPKDGYALLKDDVRPKEAHRVITARMTAETLLLDKRIITVDDIHWLLGISAGTTHPIMHQRTFEKSVLSVFVPHQLTAE